MIIKDNDFEDAQFILDNSDLLIKSDCKIVDDVLYENCKQDDKLYCEQCYRYFITTDDYDYIEDAETIAKLNELFA
jgi:hypothetical protein